MGAIFACAAPNQTLFYSCAGCSRAELQHLQGEGQCPVICTTNYIHWEMHGLVLGWGVHEGEALKQTPNEQNRCPGQMLVNLITWENSEKNPQILKNLTDTNSETQEKETGTHDIHKVEGAFFITGFRGCRLKYVRILSETGQMMEGLKITGNTLRVYRGKRRD
ncbi:hypothetical protein KI387_042483 [Taxus chinensis]|uniref:Uncharacterized protein n=1 Tax=Taxus chinensis TaxID=29808 RepID=A0AA38C8J6_TAXCH|nr:hypothetical protein KI387_042483 [Taxus chinensis]